MTNKPWETLSQTEIKELQEVFLNWYDKHKRNLPWRMNTDPYRVWISEIMLQQTRVDTVIDYYYRFMETFPTIAALAAADEEKLLKVWEGLGYYSRARNLQAAARQMTEAFAGAMPTTVDEIASLKGIGPYTTGAIASISFGLPEPAIDGNVMRVVSRLFEIEADIAKASSRKVFDEAMRVILPVSAPGDFNQALMDLGSSICTPRNPNCPECPLNKFCRAYQDDKAADFPVKTKKTPPKPVYYAAAAIENTKGEFWLVQRPENGLLAKMWTFPLLELEEKQYQNLKKDFAKDEPQQTELLVAEESDAEYLLPFENSDIIWQKRHLGEVTHVFSHLKWHLLLFYGRMKGDGSPQGFPGQWVAKTDFATLVFPKPQQKLVEQLDKNRGDNKVF